jgi:hypothetical protein
MFLRLEAAAKEAFPPGSGVTGRTLKRMAAQGRLRIYRWAGKDFTTLADVHEAVRESAILVSGKTAPADDGRAVERCERAIEAIRRGSGPRAAGRGRGVSGARII